MITDAQYQRWLERSATAPRCALFELTFLGSDGGSVTAPQEHRVYLSNMPYITRGTDSPAHQEFDYCVVEEPSFTRRMGEQLEGRSTQSYGELIVSNECELDDEGQLLTAGVRDAWLSMNWDGRRIRMWLGDAGWPFSDFRLALDGRIVDVFDMGGYKLGFRISDKGALLDRPVMTNLLDGDGPEAGQLMPLAYGHQLTNIRPRLIDQINQIYRITMTDPGAEELWTSGIAIENPIRVRENGVRLSIGTLMTSTTIGTNTMSTAPVLHGYTENTRLRFALTGGDALPAPLVINTDYWVTGAGLTLTAFRVAATRGGSVITLTTNQTGTPEIESMNWDADTANGTFQLAASPEGLITCDCYGLGTGSGGATQVNTAGDIAYESLTSAITNTPLTSGDIDAGSLSDFVSLCPQKVSIYVTERLTFADLLDRLVLSVGGWWGFSRDGLLQFGRLDLPDSSAVPVYSFTNDDVARRTMKLIRRILPRAEVKLRGQINWTPQDTVAGSVDSYERAFFAMPYAETTGSATPASWEDDPVYHLSAARPEPPLTLLNDPAEQQTESDRRADLMQEPNGIFGFDTHQVVYLLKIGDPVEVEHPKYSGTAIVVGLTERIRGRSQIEVFCRKAAVHPDADIPEAGVEEVLTTLVYHTYSDGTEPEGSTVEAGGPAVVDDDFGVGDAGATPGQIFRIDGGWLRRTTFAEDSSFDGDEALLRYSADMTGVTHYRVTFNGKFHSSDGNGYAAIYEQAINPANSMFLCHISCGVGPPGYGVSFFDGYIQSYALFTPVEDQVYAFKLVVDGLALELFVDGVSIVAWVRPATPEGPIGLDLYDPSSAGVVKIDEFKIESIA